MSLRIPEDTPYWGISEAIVRIYKAQAATKNMQFVSGVHALICLGVVSDQYTLAREAAGKEARRFVEELNKELDRFFREHFKVRSISARERASLFSALIVEMAGDLSRYATGRYYDTMKKIRSAS